MKAIVRRIVFIIIVILCFLSITIFSGNKYEWMLDDDPNMTLPLDSDAMELSFIGLIPIIMIIISLAFTKNKQEKIVITVSGIVLLCYWLYRCRIVFLNQHSLL
jgi:hypothetical protein